MGKTKFDFSGQTAVVTGAAAGMGQAASAAFAEAGAAAYLFDIDEEKGGTAADDIRAAGGQAHFVFCDVTDSKSVNAAFERVLSEAGRLDILVNSAGGWTKKQATWETPDEEWDRIVELNLKSVFLCCKAAAPAFLRQKSGRIINMGSIGGLTAAKGSSSPPYIAAKAAVHSLTRLLAGELGGEGVAVNAIAPGTTATDRVTVARTHEEIARIGKSTAIGRIAEVEDMIGWILFLASPEAGYLMGQTITVNGGRLMV
jgi:NAD(P)-dependent dehydrogenase (short-subunit alcohol dehydrogenase family)